MESLAILGALEEKGLSEELEKILDVVSFCRDINNDFPNRDFEEEFKEIEEIALKAFKQILFKQENRGRINVVIIGNFSSGKSSIVNCLFGKEICPTKVNPTTSSITRFVYGERERIFLIKENGEKEEISHQEYINLSQHQLENMDKTKSYLFEFQYPSELLESIILYDTPGFDNPKNKFDEELTRELFLKKADAVIFVQDISKPSLEEKTLRRIKELQSLRKGLPWILVLNKADTVSQAEFEKVKEYWSRQETKKLFDDIIIYSAKEIMKLSQNEKILKETKEKIFQLLISERELLLFAEDKKKTLFGNRHGRNIELKLTAESNSGKQEYEVEVLGEKTIILKENHEKLLKKLRELALEKDKLLDRKINELRGQVILKAKENLKRVKVKPELFEPLESYKEAIELLKQAEKKHMGILPVGRIMETSKNLVISKILEDCILFAEQIFKATGIDTKALQMTKSYVSEKKFVEKAPKEIVELFYRNLIKNLEGQLISLEKRAKEHANQVKEKLDHLENTIKWLESKYKSSLRSRKSKKFEHRRRR
jgi:small GTP-binding protein